MTYVVERIVKRLSTDMLDVIGKVVTGSITMYVRGGGLFHAVVVADDLNPRDDESLAVYWDRNDNRFRTIGLTQDELDGAQREWTQPAPKGNMITHHNVMCSCNECQARQFAPFVPPPSTSEQVQLELGAPATVTAPLSLVAPNAAELELRREIADLKMSASSLADRVKVLEARLERAEHELGLAGPSEVH